MPLHIHRRLWLAGASLVALAAFSTPSNAQVTLPEVVVSAPSPIGGARSASDTFGPVTVVTPEELQRTPGNTLGDVLFDKPGITASTFAPGGASRPIIRGLDNFRVRVQENGVGTHDVSDLGEDHGVPIDPLATQQIEVIRGPATLRYGSQAIGGVVDASNNRIPDAVPPNGFAGRINGAWSSADKGREGSVILDAGRDRFAVHADAYGRAADDYRIPGGRQLNSRLRSDGQAVGGSYIFDGGYTGLALSRFASIYHVPGIEPAASNTRIDLEQIKLTGKGEYRPDSTAVQTIRYWLGVSDYKHDELGTLDNGTDGVRATFKNKEQEGRVEVQLSPFSTTFGALSTAIGTQFGHQQLGTSGEAGGLLAPNQTTSGAGYLFNELRLTDALKLQAAGRIERVNVKGTSATFPADFLGMSGDPVESAFERNFTPKSLSLSALQQLPWNLVASLTGQYVERAPRAPELLSKGAHDAPGTFEIGNPNLEVEKAKTVEASLRHPKGEWRFEATAYYTQYTGFIFKRLTGNTCGEDFASCAAGPGNGEFNQIVYSQRNATFTGAELSSQIDVAPLGHGIFGIDGQFDTVRARFEDGTNVPRMPPMRAGGGLWWREAEWFARVGLLHAYAQNSISENETPTPGYDLLKAELSHTRKFAKDRDGFSEMTVGVVGNNLLDRDVRNSVQFRKDEVLLPGRNVRLFASVKF